MNTSDPESEPVIISSLLSLIVLVFLYLLGMVNQLLLNFYVTFVCI